MTREFTVQIDLTLTVSATISVNATSDEDALKQVQGQLENQYSDATNALAQEAEAVIRENTHHWLLSVVEDQPGGNGGA